jgi:hypothetical protein
MNDMPFTHVLQWGAMWLSSGGESTVKLVRPGYELDQEASLELGNILNG